MRIFPAVLKLFPVTLISSIILITTGCQKASIDYGQQYINNSITNIILVDSISPVVSTIYKDSVITSQSGKALVGSYSDPYLGKTSADSYLQLGPTTPTDLLNNAKFDSLVLLMKCNGGYYGDTTLPITISVNQLTQQIALAEGKSYFYNATTFPKNSTPLGTRSFVLRPLTGDSANIRLSDAKGLELYNLIKTRSTLISDPALFTDYLKGLNISASTNNNIFSFKDSVVMRLYYHQTDVALQNNYFDFAFDNSSLQFNHVVADRTGTPLTSLNTTNNEIFSTATNNIGYMQSITGLYLKIGFPTIRSLLERTDYIKIVRADLIVKPVINSYSSIYPLPPVLNAAETDGADEPGTTITSTSIGSTGVETGNLFIDGVYGTNTTYTYDVTGYLQQEITNSAINKDGLLLIPPSPNRFSAMNRVVVGDALNKKNKIQLNVYYISVNK